MCAWFYCYVVFLSLGFLEDSVYGCQEVGTIGRRRLANVKSGSDIVEKRSSDKVVGGLGNSTVASHCVDCGCVLTSENRSIERNSCKKCFAVGMAEVKAEDERMDSSFFDTERFAKFFGCDFYKAQDEFLCCSLVEVEDRLAKFLGCSLSEVEDRLAKFLRCSSVEVEKCWVAFSGVS